VIVTRPIVPAAFRKLDAVAVLTGPLLPVPPQGRAAFERAMSPASAAHLSDGQQSFFAHFAM